jgi:MFS family permease
VAPIAAGIALVGIGAAGLGPSVLVLMRAIVKPEALGTGVGLVQLAGDIGGMLGPLVGTSLLAEHVALPYFLTAALVFCFVPVARWLVSIEQQTSKE